VEIRPGTLPGRKITHHAVTYLVQDDPDGILAGTTGDVRGRALLMEWAIGKGYDLYRPDTGKLLLPGSKISWDIHYHAVGEDIRDHVEIGIWLYPKGQEPKHRTYLTAFQAMPGQGGTRVVDIAPNAISVSQQSTVLRPAAMLENFQPHMHLRGKAMMVEAVLPDGTSEVVSYVGNFNFNWMTNYIYADDAAPMYPKGTMIRVTAWYDNTRANPNNPDPDQWVGFGDRTVDEMGHAWMNVTYVSDAEGASSAGASRKNRMQSAAMRQCPGRSRLRGCANRPSRSAQGCCVSVPKYSSAPSSRLTPNDMLLARVATPSRAKSARRCTWTYSCRGRSAS